MRRCCSGRYAVWRDIHILFFPSGYLKYLNSYGYGFQVCRGYVQNIEPQELRRKILVNKDLASDFEKAGGRPQPRVLG